MLRCTAAVLWCAVCELGRVAAPPALLARSCLSLLAGSSRSHALAHAVHPPPPKAQGDLNGSCFAATTLAGGSCIINALAYMIDSTLLIPS